MVLELLFGILCTTVLLVILLGSCASVWLSGLEILGSASLYNRVEAPVCEDPQA